MRVKQFETGLEKNAFHCSFRKRRIFHGLRMGLVSVQMILNHVPCLIVNLLVFDAKNQNFIFLSSASLTFSREYAFFSKKTVELIPSSLKLHEHKGEIPHFPASKKEQTAFFFSPLALLFHIV
jgi:hypothetical protein